MEAKAVLVLLILAHLIGDFLFQAWGITGKKANHPLRVLKHAVIGFTTALILTAPFWSLTLMMVLVVLCLTRLLLKTGIGVLEKRFPAYALELFFFDQALCLLFIFSSWPFLIEADLNQLSLVLGKLLTNVYPFFLNITFKEWYVMILVISGYIFNLQGGTVIVRKTLQKFDFIKKPSPAENNLTDSGDIRKRWSIGAAIGILERLLILTFILLPNYTAVGLVLAGKSLVRFQEFTDQEFTEYYLIGTLTSILVAVFIGLLLNALI